MISIITPALNSAEYIRQALLSVQQQELRGLEHIVVDGGSTDGTQEILAEHSGLRIISEPDGGIYDALNKGIQEADGDVIGLLNSDDRYSSDVLRKVASLFERDEALVVVSGKAIAFDDEMRQVRARHDDPRRLRLTIRNAMLEVPVINARFFRRRLFDHVGFFDLSFDLAADREFLIRLAATCPREAVLDTVVYEYRMHKGSKTLDPSARGTGRLAEENMRMAESLLADSELAERSSPILHRWHSEYAVTAMAAAVRAGEPANVCAAFLRGWRYDPLWPLRFPTVVASKLARRSRLAFS